jgi:hypothetical protein
MAVALHVTLRRLSMACGNWRSIALSVLVSLSLAACSGAFPLGGAKTQPRPDGKETGKAGRVTEPVSEQPPEGKRHEATGQSEVARTAPAKTPPASPPPASPPPAPAHKQLSPLPVSELLGLDRLAARNLVGLPDDTSETPPAVIWEYRHAKCVLKLNFYLEVTKKEYRVLSTKFEIEEGSKMTEQACLDAIRSAA